jgi:hypothetical protein
MRNAVRLLNSFQLGVFLQPLTVELGQEIVALILIYIKNGFSEVSKNNQKTVEVRQLKRRSAFKRTLVAVMASNLSIEGNPTKIT